MLKIKSTEFFKSFARVQDLPASIFPEIAFIGRSNVGKSSLLNDLCGCKIAKVSATPGKTQLINYFLINKIFYFVDLPGYGYAKTPLHIKKHWPELIENYITVRDQLKTVFFLLDIRRTPSEDDLKFCNWLKTLKTQQIIYIITKADKVSTNERKKQLQHISLTLTVDPLDMIPYSLPMKLGKTEVLKQIQSTVLK